MQCDNLSSSTKLWLPLFTAIILSSCSSNPKITPTIVSELLYQVDMATINKNIDIIMDDIASDAKIEIKDLGSGRATSLNKEAYRLDLLKSFSTMGNYDPSRTPPQVTVAANGESAVVKDTINELLPAGDSTANVTSIRTETIGIGVEKGKLVITSISGSFETISMPTVTSCFGNDELKRRQFCGEDRKLWKSNCCY